MVTRSEENRYFSALRGRRRTRKHSIGALVAWATVLTLAGQYGACVNRAGCLGGDDGVCLPESACTGLNYECTDQALSFKLVGATSDRPPGLSSLAAAGDLVLTNGRVQAVIDAIDSPHHFAPSGGMLLDLRSVDSGGDSLNQVFQAVGILPDDTARFTSWERLEAANSISIIVRGHLDLRPDLQIVTRYELRSCEPGLRIRTELYHGGRDPLTVFLSDAYLWGGRGPTPFVPLPGQGFAHPDLDLGQLDRAFRDPPFFAARGHSPNHSSYACVPCQQETISGFHSETLTAAGVTRRILMPGDSVSYERFLVAAPAPGLSAATALALEAREKLFSEPSVKIEGRVLLTTGEPVVNDERMGRFLVYEPGPPGLEDDPASRRPWTEIVPGLDGRFVTRLPAGRSFRVEAQQLGRALPKHFELSLGNKDQTLDDWVVSAPAKVDIEIVDSFNKPLIADIVLVPALPTVANDVRGSIYGMHEEKQCAPYLGPPHGASPGCNRALVGASGRLVFAAPAGTFFVYASHGPFWSLARQRVILTSGQTQTVRLQLQPLKVVPPDTFSADFHVHGGASYDSELPERHRVQSLVANDLQVIAATDHDVVSDYSKAIADLQMQPFLHILPGIETTGDILFLRPPGSTLPTVIGHYNFWPLSYNALQSKNGGPDDERLEPGALFDLMSSLFTGEGVIQMNHPYASTAFGRDQGYFSAIAYDPRIAIPEQPNNSAAGQLRRRPGAQRSNLDYHAQEVMNGRGILRQLHYRAGWHSLLNQGILRAGTANSDTHTLAAEVPGYPRNLVFAPGALPNGAPLAQLDRNIFNAAVRDGQMVGTNGPVLEVCFEIAGECVKPSLNPVSPSATSQLRIRLSCAPWIPVEDVRVVVNGHVLTQLSEGTWSQAPDPFGIQPTRYEATIPMSELVRDLSDEQDFWLVVEAGLPLPVLGDTDDDGLVDSRDRNADGLIDSQDRLPKGAAEQKLFEDLLAVTEGESRFHLNSIAPETWPMAFTNPLLVDRLGDGWQAPGLH